MNACCFFYCFLVLDELSLSTAERDRKKHFRIFAGVGLVIAVLSILLTYYGRDKLGGYLTAFYGGLAMAYFMGRFDSLLMKIPRGILAPLYLYALLQVAWLPLDPDSPKDSPLFTACIWLALLLKMLLFVIITRWLTEGTLFKYVNDAEELLKCKAPPGNQE